MTALLRISDLHVSYGAVPAVRGVHLELPPGDLRVILGANGAGKTTIIKAVLGLLKAQRGSVEFAGRDITGWPPHRVNRLGIAWVPEGRQVWDSLTVLDNLRMGAFAQRDDAETARRIDEMFDRFPRLRERQGQLAGSLSGGEQQMVAIARALVARPRLLLMDEPSLGLAPLLVREIFAVIREIRGQGTTIVLVEQNARMALAVADHGYVLETGTVCLADRADALLANPSVQAAYLGGAA